MRQNGWKRLQICATWFDSGQSEATYRPRHALYLALLGILSLALATSALAMLVWPKATLAAPPAQAPEVRPSVSAGRVLWGENCLPCHGPTGQGDGPTSQDIDQPLPNFADPQFARQLVPAENFNTIKNGRIENLMPPWGNRLNDTQIWDLTARVWRHSTTAENLAAGELIYNEQCAACHGDDGQGNTPNAPAEMIDFTDLQAMVQRSQVDLQEGYAASPEHVELTFLSDEELWQSLDYVRTFSFAVPQRNGVLSGQVVNGSTNQPAGNLQLTLHVFDGDVEIETLMGQADSSGFYSFANLPTDHSIIYFVEGRYQGVPYLSEAGLFIPNSNETTLDLDVYETTSSRAAITISRLNYLMSFVPNALNVVQLFMIGNSDNKTYVGQNGQTLAFELPESATNVVFQNDSEGRFIQTDNGYVDTQPILPGEEQNIIAVIYDIPIDRDSLSFDVPIPADVASVNVLMRAQGAELSGDQLQFIETRQFESRDFSFFSATDLREGDKLTLELTELDNLAFDESQVIAPSNAVAASATMIDQNQLSLLIIGLGGMAILFAGFVYPRFRSQLTKQSSSDPEESILRRQRLLFILARLDDMFEAGEIDKQVYGQARARYKAQLMSLMMNESQSDDQDSQVG